MVVSTSERAVSLIVEDGVARVTLHVPPLNILTSQVLRELRSALKEAEADQQLRVLLLDAAGKHFSAGASVEEHLPAVFRDMLAEFESTVLALHEFALPVIAAVQGRCLGGAFELVQAADIIVAATDAQFGQPEIKLGVMAPVACALLPRRTGATMAAELLFTGSNISAGEAAAAGLVRRVVPAAQLADESLALAREIARHSASSLRLTKQAMRRSQREIRPALAAAAQLYEHQLMASQDAVEGLQAFVQKRTPQWTHQ